MTPSPDDAPIEVLGLPVGTYNCLRRAGKRTVGQLLATTDEELLAIRQFSVAYLGDIRNELAAYMDKHIEFAPQPSTAEAADLSLLPGQAEMPDSSPPLLALPPAEVLNLSAHSNEALRKVGCRTVNDMVALVEAGLPWSLRYFGHESLTEIKKQLDALFARYPLLVRPTPLQALDLPVRSYNALMRHGVYSVETLLQLSNEDLLCIRNIGTKSATEIKDRLSAYLHLHPELARPVIPPDVVEPLPPPPPPSPPPSPALPSVEVLSLSARSNEALRRAGCRTVNDVVALVEAGLPWSLRYFGHESLTEIKKQLDALFARYPLLVRPTPLQALDLPVRSYNALMRHGVCSVDTLVQLSDEELLDIRNIGTKSAAEIKDRLSAYLHLHPELARPVIPPDVVKPLPPPPPPPPLIDPDELAAVREKDIPLDKITVERLALSELDQQLLRRDNINTIGELAQQPRDKWERKKQISHRLNRYLDWLVEQDAALWADEVDGLGISPLIRLDLAGGSLRDFVQKWLSSLNERGRQIIEWRCGFYGARLTLEEAGERLGITRERVRQIEKGTIKKLRYRSRQRGVLPLVELLRQAVARAGGLATEAYLGEVLAEVVDIDGINPPGVARLLLAAQPEFVEVRKIDAWALSDLPIKLIPEINRHLARILAAEYTPLCEGDLLNRFKATSWYQRRADALRDEFILACLHASEAIVCCHENTYGLEKWERHRTDKVILALRALGEPAHYAEIARQANEPLEAGMRTPARNFYAMLCHHTELFVRVGRGIFGLKEWGLPDDGNLANAAYRVLTEASKPLHIEAITDLVLETWHVGRPSVQAAILQDDRFYRAAPATFGLLEWEIERLDEDLPVLHICPPPLPDRRGERNTFFESVLVAHNFLCERPTVESFLTKMLEWVGTDKNKSERYLQNVLNAYYIVGLIPYVVYRRVGESSLRSTLPQASDLQALRHFCLNCMLERLEGMHDFLALLAARQPCTATELTNEFHADIYALRTARDEVLNRLRILRSLGILAPPDGGRYRLTETGVVQSVNVEISDPRFQHTSTEDEALTSPSVNVDEDIGWLDITW